MTKLFFVFVTLLHLYTFTLALPAHAASICDEITDDATKAACNACSGTDVLNVWTGIGCLRAGEPKVFIGQILGWSIGIGSGIAFLIILYAAFQITTAAGNPKQVQAARELLTSAIMGLILIVCSIVLLNFVGFTVLKLPGF